MHPVFLCSRQIHYENLNSRKKQLLATELLFLESKTKLETTNHVIKSKHLLHASKTLVSNKNFKFILLYQGRDERAARFHPGTQFQEPSGFGLSGYKTLRVGSSVPISKISKETFPQPEKREK